MKRLVGFNLRSAAVHLNQLALFAFTSVAMATVAGSADSKRLTAQRKRAACGELRALASELGLQDNSLRLDMTAEQFRRAAGQLEERCATPEQRQQLERAVNRCQNLEVPPLPTRAAQNAGGGAAREAGEDARRNFRLRATGCMFTYNSADFQRIVWPEFLAWLGTLNFLLRWTATMEQSLRSSVEGRLHLHVFTEFQQAIDWTSLRSVLFRGVTPHASPCTARGPNVRDALNRGHFYVFANKQGALEVATSGWVPWSDYGVNGWWIDNLWTEHKLCHDVYLEYARRGYSSESFVCVERPPPFEQTLELQC